MVAKKMYRRKYTKRPVRKATAKGRKPSKTFIKNVQRVISANAENKQAFTSTDNKAIYQYAVTNANITAIMPTMALGTANNARIGDQVKLKKINISGWMAKVPLESASYTPRIALRMMVVCPKEFPTYVSAVNGASTWLGALLKRGATTSAFTGDLKDLYSPINTDAVTCIKDKIYYISSPGNSGTSSMPTNSVKFFNVNLPGRNRVLKYDNSVSSATLPINYSYFVVCGYVNLDGTAPGITSNIELNIFTKMEYEDA